MESRTSVFQAVDRERRYWVAKWGSVEENPNSLAGWILVLEKKLAEVKTAWASDSANEQDLQEILQLVAVGVACLEQYGVVERPEVVEADKERAYILHMAESSRFTYQRYQGQWWLFARGMPSRPLTDEEIADGYRFGVLIHE